MKLTWEILIQLGFRGEGRDITDKPAYRLKVPVNEHGYYHYQFQIVLGDYPESNPNSGILSLYEPLIKDAHMITETKLTDEDYKVDFIMWDCELTGQRGGIKYIDIKEVCLPIAWHVTTVERLNEIYVALTGNPPLEIKNKP